MIENDFGLGEWTDFNPTGRTASLIYIFLSYKTCRQPGLCNHQRKMPHIPQELIDQIIDEVHSDTKTLNACALTCLDWVPRCRQHLHRSLTIGVSFPPHQHTHILFFLKYPHLTYYVRSLNIFSTMDDLGRWPVSFPEATSLRIMFMSWDVQRLGARDHLLTQLPSITTLTLAGIEFETFQSFATLLTAFPHLSNLVLSTITVKEPIVHTNYYGQHGFGIRRLELRDMDIPTAPFIHWLQNQVIAPTIRSMDLGLGGKRFYDRSLQEWCKIAGTSLHHLRFDLGWVLVDQDLRNGVFSFYFFSYSDLLGTTVLMTWGCWVTIYINDIHSGSIDLRHNTQLRTLEVRTIGLGRFSLYHHEWIPTMLQRLPPQNLKRITLHIHFYELHQLDSQGLSRIDQALGGTSPDVNYWVRDWRKGLEIVEIVLWYNRKSLPDFTPIVQCVQDRMPRAVMNGALKCYHGVEYEAMYAPF